MPVFDLRDFIINVFPHEKANQEHFQNPTQKHPSLLPLQFITERLQFPKVIAERHRFTQPSKSIDGPSCILFTIGAVFLEAYLKNQTKEAHVSGPLESSNFCFQTRRNLDFYFFFPVRKLEYGN
jgi:hypothetical protein